MTKLSNRKSNFFTKSQENALKEAGFQVSKIIASQDWGDNNHTLEVRKYKNFFGILVLGIAKVTTGMSKRNIGYSIGAYEVDKEIDGKELVEIIKKFRYNIKDRIIGDLSHETIKEAKDY